MPTVVIPQQPYNGTPAGSSIDVPPGATGVNLNLIMAPSVAAQAQQLHIYAEQLVAGQNGQPNQWVPLNDWLVNTPVHDKGGNLVTPSVQSGIDPVNPPLAVRGSVDTLAQTIDFGLQQDWVMP